MTAGDRVGHRVAGSVPVPGHRVPDHTRVTRFQRRYFPFSLSHCLRRTAHDNYSCFPAFRIRAVKPLPLQKYVRITFRLSVRVP